MKGDGGTTEAPVATEAIGLACAEEPRRAGPPRPGGKGTTPDGATERDTAARIIGRYVLFREVACGGMATVHLGRLRGVGGFARTVAIKRLLPPFARDPEFVSMFLDEARLAARIQHPNVVSVLDVVASEGELFLVMEYVHGEGLSKLLRRARARGIPVPQGIVVGILIDVLYGLHAAHEARNERGDPLQIVHRDVSPQNVIVGVDGVARVLDFGIAKAAQSAHSPTGVGQLKGKLAYMAPEQVASGVVDRRADVYAAGVTLWEALTGQRMFPPLEFPQLMAQILTKEHVPPSQLVPGASPELDAVVLCALERDPGHRYATAGAMATDLERIVRLPTKREIGEWVASVADGPLRARAAFISEIESTTFAEIAPRNAPASGLEPAPASEPALKQAPEAERIEPTSSDLVPPARARKWPTAWLASSSALALAALLGVAARQAAPPAMASPASAAVSTLPAPPRSALALDAVPPASGWPVDPVASSAAIEPAAPPASARPWWAGLPPPRRSAAGPKPRPPEDCTPPYTLDANGVRIPKRWCS